MFCIPEVDSVYCAVRTESLYKSNKIRLEMFKFTLCQALKYINARDVLIISLFLELNTNPRTFQYHTQFHCLQHQLLIKSYGSN
jgi:hypothetical protein